MPFENGLSQRDEIWYTYVRRDCKSGGPKKSSKFEISGEIFENFENFNHYLMGSK